MITLLEDNTISTPEENVNSGHSHKAKTPLTKALADAFIYPAITDDMRPDSEIVYQSIAFDGRQIQIQKAQVDAWDGSPRTRPARTFYNRDGSIKYEREEKTTIPRLNKKYPVEPETLTILDDLTAQPQRVQNFAAFVFTDELRAEIQAEEDAAEIVRIEEEEKKIAKAAAKEKKFNDAVSAEVTKQLAEHFETEH